MNGREGVKNARRRPRSLRVTIANLGRGQRAQAYDANPTGSCVYSLFHLMELRNGKTDRFRLKRFENRCTLA